MSENRQRKLRRIRIKPVTVTLAFIVIFAFLALTTKSKEGSGETNRQTVTEDIKTYEVTPKKSETVEAKWMVAEVSPKSEEHIMIATPQAKEQLETKQKAKKSAESKSKTGTKQDKKDSTAEDTRYWEEIPLSKEVQQVYLQYCEMYDCPLALAIATTDVETDFNENVIGAAGEEGLMQIYPGSGRKYFKELIKVTGFDPATRDGNIACGCYLLGKYYNQYRDIEKAAMAYNNGLGGAKSLWAKGITSSEYSRKVKAAYLEWDDVIKGE